VSTVVLQFKSNFFSSLEWPIARILWIGQMKNKPAECLFARLPKEIVSLILQFCGEEKLKFLPENENELQLVSASSKTIYIGWYGDKVDWLDLKGACGPVWISFNKQHFVSSWLEEFRNKYHILQGVAECERETEEDNRKETQQKDSPDEEEDDVPILKKDWLFLECFDD